MRDFRSLTPEDFLRILWRRKWYFFILLVGVSCGVAFYAYQMPLVYRSETTIVIESALMPEDYVRPAVRTSPEDRIHAIRLQVQSRKFLEQIVQEFQLFGYGSGANFNMETATASFARSIKIESLPGGSAFRLSFSALEPQAAREVTRRLAAALIQSNQSARRLRAVETDQFIEAQLRQTERDLNAQEEKIKQFKMTHLGQLPEQGAANLNLLSGLQTQLAAGENALQTSREHRKLLEFKLQEQKRLDALPRNLFSAEIPGSAESSRPAPPTHTQLEQKRALLAELTAKYTPKHPDVVRLTLEVRDMERRQALERESADEQQAERATTLTPLGQGSAAGTQAGPPGVTDDRGIMFDVAAAEIRMEMERTDGQIARKEKERGEIERQMKVVQGRLNLAPALEQELASLNRDHEVLRRQYADLQSKKFSSQMSAALETDTRNETYRIVDEANLPTGSAFPDRLQIILMGIGAGFLVGLGAAFGREYLDPTLRLEEEVTAALGLPVLIAIPELPKQRAQKRLLGLGGSP